ATGHPAANDSSSWRRTLRSRHLPPAVPGFAAKDPDTSRDYRSLPIRGEGQREDGTDYDCRRFDGPVPPAVSRAQQTALRSQKQMVGIGWADRERDGAGDDLPAIGRDPCRAMVARAEQSAPGAGIVALYGTCPKGQRQREQQDMAPGTAELRPACQT